MAVQLRHLTLLALLVLALSSLPSVSLAQDEDFADDDDEAARAAAEEIASEAAEEDIPERPDHLLTDIPGPSSFVSVRSIFLPRVSPSDPLPTFIVDKPNTVLLSLYNSDGNRPFNVWGVTGSVNSVYSKYDQNFTFMPSNTTLSAGYEMSIAYTFTPSTHLVSKEYQLALTVFYHRHAEDADAGLNEMYSASTFFNQTVTIREREGEIDNTFFYLAFLFVVGAVVGAILGRGAIAKALKGGSAGSKVTGQRATPAIETGTKAQANVEWIPEHNLRSRKNWLQASTAPDRQHNSSP